MSLKFVILSQPRTGSSLLASALKQHPQIKCWDEVLNQWQSKWFSTCPPTGRERLVHCLSVSGFRAVGCKLHTSHPDPQHKSPLEWESAWDALYEDPEIRVVCLYRQNVIAQLASWKIASKTKQWGVQNIEHRPVVTINPSELWWFFKWNQVAYQARLGRLRRHQIAFVEYEDLCLHWESTIEQIQAFLTVNPLPLSQSIQKGETRDLGEAVQNYAELKLLPWINEPVVVTVPQ